MEHALLNYGLPVKCAWGDCETTGFVKPQTDYGGWMRRGHINIRKRWICPKHAEIARERYRKVEEQYATPEPVATVESIEEELYALLDN